MKVPFHYTLPCTGYYNVFVNLLGKSCVIMVFIYIYFTITEATFSILFKSSIYSFVNHLFDRAHPPHHKQACIDTIQNSLVKILVVSQPLLEFMGVGEAEKAPPPLLCLVTAAGSNRILLHGPEQTMCPVHLLLGPFYRTLPCCYTVVVPLFWGL